MKRKLKLSVELFRHKLPVFCIGFIGRYELLVSIWIIDFRVEYGY